MEKSSIKDIEPKIVPGEKIFELFGNEAGNFSVALAEIEESKLHYHEKTHEWYLIVEGDGEVHLDGKRVPVSKDDFLYIKPGAKHKAKKMGEEPLKLFVITSPPWSQEDHHLLK